MIKEMTIKNFKCFGPETPRIPLAPLTLLYGQNSAGKSTVIQALRMHCNIMASKAQKREDVAFLGHRTTGDSIPFSGVVFRGETKNRTVVSLAHSNNGNNIVTDTKISGSQASDCYTVEALWKSVAYGIEYSIKNDLGEKGISVHDVGRAIEFLAPVMQSAHDTLLASRETILRNYERYIELVCLQQAYNSNSSFRLSVVTAAKPGWDLEYGSCYSFDEERISRHTPAGLENWIAFAPPEWLEYRNSHDYVHLRKMIEQKLVKDIAYFSTPFTLEATVERYSESIIKDLLQVPKLHALQTRLADATSLTLLCRDILLSDANPTIHYHCGDSVVVGHDDGTSGSEKWVSPFGFSFSFKHVRQQYFGILEKHVKQHLVFDLPILRSVPPVRPEPQAKYDPTSPDYGWLIREPKLKKKLNDWLNNLETGYMIDFNLDNTGRYSLMLINTNDEEDIPINISEVGYGFSQLLPVIQTCIRPEPSLILIEEPELHIHPGLQAEIGSLFLHAIKDCQHQLVVETHSEHLMLRLQKLIRKGELKPDDVSVLYVSRLDDGSNIQRLRIDDDGEFLTPWPKGFFPERLTEILGG